MTLRIPDHIVWQDLPGDLALFDTKARAYHALNGSAAAIWRAVAAGTTEPDMVAALAARYDAPREEVARDVADFIADALARDLLVESTV